MGNKSTVHKANNYYFITMAVGKNILIGCQFQYLLKKLKCHKETRKTYFNEFKYNCSHQCIYTKNGINHFHYKNYGWTARNVKRQLILKKASINKKHCDSIHYILFSLHISSQCLVLNEYPKHCFYYQ